ncbi:MAG: hypothetical protein E6Q97_10435 [Desulfurellales bacterium]|nr:MAG: hypothetical protein E6Q97_10435 [Desulfurellales bacterium]
MAKNEGIYYETKQFVEDGIARLYKDLADAGPMLDATIPGAHRLNDEEFLAYVTSLVQRYPREPIVTPDGRVLFESPAILAWKHIPDLEDEYDRYTKIFGESYEKPMSPGMGGEQDGWS